MHSDEQDPTAWLGDPVGVHAAGAGEVVVSVPPAERDSVVISLLDAPRIEDFATYARLNLNSARGLHRSLEAAIAQLEEHAAAGE